MNDSMQKRNMGNNFGAYLRRLRQVRGLSLRDLERQTQIGRGRLSQLETGVNLPSLDLCRRLAPALGLPLVDLALAAGHQPSQLPSLQPYLRQAYGLEAADAADVARYIRDHYGPPTGPAPGEDELPEHNN